MRRKWIAAIAVAIAVAITVVWAGGNWASAKPLPPHPIDIDKGARPMTFPQTGILDNFNRTEMTVPPTGWGTFDASWYFTDQWWIQAYGLEYHSVAFIRNYWLQKFGRSQEIYYTLDSNPIPDGMTIRMYLLLTLPNGDYAHAAFYGVEVQHNPPAADAFIFIRRQNGTTQFYGTNALTIAPGDSYGAVYNQATHTLSFYRKPSGGSWTLAGTLVDPDPLPQVDGYLALEGAGTPIRVDDFGGGTLVETPANLQASGVAPQQINLQWTSSLMGSFEIERSANGSTGWTLIDTVNGDITSYQDTDVAIDTKYFYRVRAQANSGYSGYSNVAMARTLTNRLLMLVRRSDAGGDVDAVDLLRWLARDGYVQAAADDETMAPVDEVVTVHIPGDDDDDLALQVQLLDRKIKEVQWAHNPLEPNGVWLRTQQEHETGGRQAYLLAARRSQEIKVSGMFAREAAPHLAEYEIGLTRQPLWEESENTNLSGSSINVLGGKMNYTVGGDAPARCWSLVVAPTPPGNATPHYLNEIWIGAKSDRQGDPAIFQPVWDLTLAGTLGADTVLSSGTLVCNFATQTSLVPRATISIEDAVAQAGYWAGQAGRYLILLRTYITGTAEVNARIGSGYAGTTAFKVGTRQAVSATSAWLVALGEIDLPITWLGGATMGQAALRVEAELLSGSGTLVMDRLVLIPALEGYLSLRSELGARAIQSAATREIVVYQRPDGRSVGNVDTPGAADVLETFAPDLHGWGVPPGSGVMVFAAQGDTNGASRLDAAFNLFQRWYTLRGAG